MRDLVSFVHRDPRPQVLVVTNMWPEPQRPVYGIFVQRQVASIRAAGIRCDVLYVRGYRSVLAYPVAALLLAWWSVSRRGRYRLIHAHAAEAAVAARFHVGTPVIASFVGDDVLGDRDDHGRLTLNGRARSAVVRALSPLFTATITKSRAMEAALPAAAIRHNHVIPNGVDRGLFRPTARSEARTRLGWGDELVALFACTKPQSAAKRLWLAERACEAAAVRLHVASDVEPALMPILMSAADCLLVTSAVEGSPNVVKEALACNLPVVATAVGDIPERLEGVDPSWICEPEEAALADAVRACMAAPRRSNGREVAAALDEGRIAGRIAELYHEVAGIEAAVGLQPDE